MKHGTLGWLITLLLTFVITASAESAGPVVVIPIRTEVSQAQFFFLRRVLKEAEALKAEAIILEIDTYGGEGRAAVNSMDALMKSTIPTFTYVDNKAISAGALIALATQKIYMAPTAVIGAAAPVMATGDDLPKTMTDKTVSAMSAMARAASQKNGHNAEIADAFIRKEKELKIGETVIDKAETLLTLSAEEAARAYDGKPLLAAGLASTLNEMVQKAGLKGPIQRFEPTGFERMAFWVTALAPLLLLGGMIGGYIEVKTPGFGLPGFVSIVCFTLFFTGHYVAGLAGWEAPVCFAIGVALIVGELVLHPGTILPGVIGVLMVLAAIIYAMVDRWPSQPMWPSQEMLVRPLANLSVALLLTLVSIWALAKYLPRTSLYHAIVLENAVPSGPKVTELILDIHVGMTGTATTTLRPSGKAQFKGELIDVVTNGSYIETGESIRVLMVEGARVVVEQV